jgi:YcxB-like protein
MVVVTFRYTDAHFLQAQRRFRRQSRDWRAGCVARLLLAAMMLSIFIGTIVLAVKDRHLSGNTLIGLAALLFIVILSVMGGHLVEWRLLRAFRQSPYRDELLQIEFRDDGFYAMGERSAVSLRWSVFTKVVHFRDGFLLFQGPGLVNWIPVRHFENPEAVAEVAALLRDNIENHQIIEAVRPERSKDNWD